MEKAFVKLCFSLRGLPSHNPELWVLGEQVWKRHLCQRHGAHSLYARPDRTVGVAFLVCAFVVFRCGICQPLTDLVVCLNL